MARPKSDLTKHTLHLYEGDYARLQDFHPEVGAASVIREIVRAYLDKLASPVTNINTGDIDV